MRLISHGGLGIKNTVGACRQASLLGLDLEVDVRLSLDGVPILSHDATRHSDNIPWNTIHSYECVRLEDILDQPYSLVDLELKEIEALHPLMDVVKRLGLPRKGQRILVTSKDIDTVLAAQVHYGHLVEVGIIINRPWRVTSWCSRSKEERDKLGRVVVIRSTLVEHIPKGHDFDGVEVFLWTVNDVNECEHIAEMPDVGGVITDVPILLKDQMPHVFGEEAVRRV